MLDLKGRLRRCLKFAGKGETKIASVFGANAAAAHKAVLHVREGAPGVPVWLFTTVAPLPETEPLCERIYRNGSGLALAVAAERHLWPHSVAIGIATWTGSAASALKIAPFLIPPFRVLILNREGDFFSGTPSNILVHCGRTGWDSMQLVWRRIRGGLHSARSAIRDARVRGGDLFRGLLKLAAATGLRAAATLLHRFLPLFQRLHGDQPLILDLEASAGNSLVHFTQSDSHWDGEELERVSRASDARWILWRNEGEADPLSDAEPLFDDDRTFAASRQVHFRGWKKAVAPTAPFRRLQAGEATRVLAPLSGSILVDRKKLLALGIPRSSMPGTAWLILFWKAAAAGWRSCTGGFLLSSDRA